MSDRISRWISNTRISDTQIQVTVPEYTGRTSRVDAQGVVVQTAGGASDSAQVNQSGIPEFISPVTASPVNLPNTSSEGQRIIYIQFRSNSTAISANITQTGNWLSIDDFLVDDVVATLDQAIEGDPGSSGAYTGKLALFFDANEGADRSATIRISTAGGSYIDYVVNQYGADSTITLTPNPLSFDSKGGTKTITVTSNDNWTLV